MPEQKNREIIVDPKKYSSLEVREEPRVDPRLVYGLSLMALLALALMNISSLKAYLAVLGLSAIWARIHK